MHTIIFTRYGEATKRYAHSQGGGSRNSRFGVSHYEEEDGLHAETSTVEHFAHVRSR